MDKEFSLSESSVSFCIERTLGGAMPLSQVIVLKQVFYTNRVNLHGKDEMSHVRLTPSSAKQLVGYV
jgi:hypothetical protein